MVGREPVANRVAAKLSHGCLFDIWGRGRVKQFLPATGVSFQQCGCTGASLSGLGIPKHLPPASSAHALMRGGDPLRVIWLWKIVRDDCKRWRSSRDEVTTIVDESGGGLKYS